jgi:hypothetical protein
VRVNPLGHCVNRATKKSKEFAPLHRCRGGLRKVIWTVSLVQIPVDFTHSLLIIIETFARGCQPKHAPATIRIDTS